MLNSAMVNPFNNTHKLNRAITSHTHQITTSLADGHLEFTKNDCRQMSLQGSNDAHYRHNIKLLSTYSELAQLYAIG
jgi:hypothetical protein